MEKKKKSSYRFMNKVATAALELALPTQQRDFH